MLTVVKVGGSYAHSCRLREIVAALERGAGRIAVVPGGGPFADTVRREQSRIGYGESAAHRMALLAMAQFGIVLVTLRPLSSGYLVPAASLDAIRGSLSAGRIPVWLPLDLLDGHAGIPESWDMTSDSLAAWLAGRLGAQRLIYMKSADPPDPAGAAELVARGMLDPLAPACIAAENLDARICAPGDIAELGAALAGGLPLGRRIALT